MNYGKNWVTIFHYYYADWIGPKKKKIFKVLWQIQAYLSNFLHEITAS